MPLNEAWFNHYEGIKQVKQNEPKHLLNKNNRVKREFLVVRKKGMDLYLFAVSIQ